MAAEGHRALDAVAAFLRCPVCGEPVLAGEDQVRCSRRHSFNIARQGYVSLTGGHGGPRTGDSSAMVMAREEFLGAGHYRPLAGVIADLAAVLDKNGPGTNGSRNGGPGLAPGLVLDLAGGTGYYLGRVLDALPGRLGVCVDLSAPALRRAARAHPRAAALGADAWQALPLADGAVALVLSVFGPRNPAEIRRVLAPGGALIVAAPGADHLAELRGPLGLIGIDERKAARLAGAYRDYAQAAGQAVRYSLSLGHADVTRLVAMGPSARHIDASVLAERVAALPDPVTVSVDVEVRGYRDRDSKSLSRRRGEGSR